MKFLLIVIRSKNFTAYTMDFTKKYIDINAIRS